MGASQSLLAKWFLKLKMEVTLEEAQRLNLRILNLSTRGLLECPNFMAELTHEYLQNLKCLLMHSNYLTSFSQTACHCLGNLKGLTLDYNRLTDLPFDFRHMNNLTVLNVSHNKFSGLHFFHVICQLKTLKVLWANATGIREIPAEIKALQRLRTLGLRSNKIRALPVELCSLKNLKWLTLSNNKIQNVPYEIGQLRRLVHLNLQRNLIVRLPPSLGMLRELQFLFLQNNFLVVDDDLIVLIRSIPKLKRGLVSRNLPGQTDENPDPDNNPASVHEIIGTADNTPHGFSPWSVSRPSSLTDLQNHAVAEAAFAQGLLRDLENAQRQDSLNNNPTLERGMMEAEGQAGSVLGTEDLHTVFRKNSQLRTEISEYPNSGDRDTTSMSNSASDAIHGGRASQSQEVFAIEIPVEKRVEFSENEHFVQLPTIQPEATNEGDERQNFNCNPDRSIKQRRTEEWVMLHSSDEQLQRNQSRNQSSTGVKNVRSSRSSKSILSGLQENLSEEVNALIDEAVKKVNEASHTNLAAVARRSNVYFMSQGEELPKLTRIASAHSSCQRSASVVSKSLKNIASAATRKNESDDKVKAVPVEDTFLLSILLNDEEQQQEQQGEVQVEQDNGQIIWASSEVPDFSPFPPSTDTIGIAEEVERMVNPVATDTTLMWSLSSGVEIVDAGSSNDPSEWDHSTPSSAIDDQDIAARFADPHPNAEGMEQEQFIPLTEEDWLRLAPLIVMR